MQRAVADRWDDLEGPLLAAMPGAGTIEWLSPLAEDHYAEYRDASFLGQLKLGHLSDDLARFWPSLGPQWDGLARSDKGHVILAEAKAHIGEFCSPGSQAAGSSLVKIKASLLRAALAMGVDPEDAARWHRQFYQYTNRLAHLFWLREHGVEAKLVLIGLIHDDDMPGTTTPEAWQAAYRVANFALGLAEGHPLARHIIHVHPDVRGR
jgi:hypothetical protein